MDFGENPTDVDMVRLLISDVDLAHLSFIDDEIQMFLDIEGGDVRLGAALALETLASNEALVFKKIRTEGLMQTDGPAVARSLMDRAALLRAQSDGALADGGFQIADGGCALAEMAENPYRDLYGPGF